MLKLNAIPESYKEFYGKNAEQMSKLIADGRVPMNTSQLMQIRLDSRNYPEEVKTAWMDNFFDTGDAVIYHPNGDVKIVLDSQALREMTYKSPRNIGALVLDEDVYKTLQGEVFKKGKFGKINDGMSREDVKVHPIWRVLARDQALLNDYTDLIFAEGQERFGYNLAMGVSLGSCSGNNPEMRAWFVGKLGYSSYVCGVGDIAICYGRFVGIAPNASSVRDKCALDIKAYSMADLLAFDKAIKGLEGTLHPDILNPFKELRKKL